MFIVFVFLIKKLNVFIFIIVIYGFEIWFVVVFFFWFDFDYRVGIVEWSMLIINDNRSIIEEG